MKVRPKDDLPTKETLLVYDFLIKDHKFRTFLLSRGFIRPQTAKKYVYERRRRIQEEMDAALSDLCLKIGNWNRVQWDIVAHRATKQIGSPEKLRGRKAVGNRIRAYRTSIGLSQGQLASAADMGDDTAVAAIEAGLDRLRFRYWPEVGNALGLSPRAFASFLLLHYEKHIYDMLNLDEVETLVSANGGGDEI